MDQQNNMRIRKSVSKAELKSRLYDKGISIQTMPSVKRLIPDNVKQYAARLTPLTKQPVFPYKGLPNFQGMMQSIQVDDQLGTGRLGGTMRSSTSQLEIRQQFQINQQQNVQFKRDFQMSTLELQQRDLSPNEQFRDSVMKSQRDLQQYDGQRPQTSTDAITGGFQKGSSVIGKSVSNPQFTTLNMAPYSRPQTQAFGFRNSKLQSDPSRKVAKASEEVTSITGIKTMTALGPAALNRQKANSQDLLKKRSQSNKALKRMIIGGRSEAEQKRKMLVDMISQEDEIKKRQQFNNSPHRKVNEKLIGGAQETTDEVLRQHFLLAKIRKQTSSFNIQRPVTSDVNFDNLNRVQSAGQFFDTSRQLSSQTNFRGAIRPLTQATNKFGGQPKSQFNFGKSLQQDKIEENLQEEDQLEDQIQSEEEKKQQQQQLLNSQLEQQQLEIAKQQRVVTTVCSNKNKKQNQTSKWNDLDKLITLLQNQPDDDGYFLYLEPSKDGDPYDLQPLIEAEQSHKGQIGAITKNTSTSQKREKFFTLSKKGITTYINDEPIEYISLTDWLIERNFFQQISDKKFFRQFKSWKIIRMWRRNILQKKREEVKNNLQEKLFHLDSTFGPILRRHRVVCKDMESLRIIDLAQPGHDCFKLSEFASNQEKRRENTIVRITEISESCRYEFKKGINSILEELRQKINDQNEDEETHKKEYMKGGEDGGLGQKEKKNLNSDPVFEQLGFKHNLKYGPRSKLRRACTRFLRFSYLLDFLAIDSLSTIYIESVKDTIKKLTYLANLKIDYELRSKITPFGEQQKKIVTPASDLPFFWIEGKFYEMEIPQELMIIEKIHKFEPIALGGQSQPEDFDPTCHLEIQEKKDMIDEEEDQHEVDEDYFKVERVRVQKLNRIWLNIEPQKNDLQSLINECFQEGLECLKHFERWSRHEELLPYVKVLESWDDKVCDEWDPPDDVNLNCDDWLQDNKYYKNQSRMVNDQLIIAFNNVFEFFSQLEPYLYNYWQNKQLGNFQIIENENLRNPTEVIPLLLQRFNDQKNNFENFLPEQRDLGMIRLNLKEIKNALTPSPKNCLAILKKMLPSMVRRRIEQDKQWLVKQIQSINKPPTNVETYVRQIQNLEYIDKHFQKYKDDIDLNNQIYHICLQYEIESKEEKNKKFVDEATITVNSLSQTIYSANESADKRKEDMKTKITTKIPKLKAKVEAYTNTLMQDKFLDINQNRSDILLEIQTLEIDITKICEKAKKVQEFQKTLELDISAFDNVENLKNEMLFRAKLWKALNEWTGLIEHWKGAYFDQIEVSEIATKADQYTKIVIQCERQLPIGSTAVQHLKKLVFDFRDTMPIVEALGNVHLQTFHWDDIKKVLGQPDYPLETKQFKLQELIELNVAEFQEDIINISVTATQEYILRTQLDEIKEIWNFAELKVIKHKDKSDVFKLSELDKIQTELDESLTNISNIIGSRYVKRLYTEAEEWQNTLNMVFDTLEQWKEFQRFWLHLDNIFASASIQKDRKSDYAEFEKINKSWQALMKKVNIKPLVKAYCFQNVVHKDFMKWNSVMDSIQKKLEDYLEQKRGEFPRFYFISNDELLSILANAQEIGKVEKYIKQCFDNISSLIFHGGDLPEIKGMRSAEGEEIKFQKPFKVKQAVEQWMKDVEMQMFATIQNQIVQAYNDYYSEKVDKERKQWVIETPCGQAIAVVSQISWTESTEQAITDMTNNPFALNDHLDENKKQLKQLTELIRTELTDIKRKILVALITTDIHGRDIVENLNQLKVNNLNDFNWQQQLRYYYIEEKMEKMTQVKQVNATIRYGNEYMGATSRLVITPLTDRCWITITGAMNINLGAAPAGPAGTGKTESTKDLAKALGIYCVVFNCSEQIEYKMMGRLFSGLAQSGSWSCLDEFNRIDIEVLSVIAQQLLDIKEAKCAKLERFNFNGKENMPLNHSCGVFVTMNPGYAGRTELPDNLKVLFRPVSMMIPAYGLIAEIMLQAEGFEEAKTLSTKMTQLYKLASEQLSQQDHYDFGMRAVKSVLVMAGTLKRANPTLSENVVLIRAMRDSNVPKFLSDDLPLFQALIQDLFPGVQIPEANFGELQQQIEDSLVDKGLQKVPLFITKTIQLFDTFNVRFGVMIVGPTGGGKTTCYEVLQDAMTKLRTIKGSSDKRYQEVRVKVLNPKSIAMGELYGVANLDTNEWTDGLASKIIRKFSKDESDRKNWCVFDGPVDALWIENMNTVLDDNMTLCLANGERVKLKWSIRMLFEVQDLAVASPATVSRCGMVYITPSDLGWRPYFQTWKKRYLQDNQYMNEEQLRYLEEQFNQYVDIGFERIQPVKEEEALPTVPVQVVKCMCNFLEYFIKNKNSLPHEDKKECERKINYYFGFSFVWSFACSFKQSAMKHLDNILRDFFAKLHFPGAETVLEYFYNEKEGKIIHWEKQVPQFEYDPKTPFFSLLVPTIDTVRYTTLLDILVQIDKPVFFTGNTGVGKSIIMQQYIQNKQEKLNLAPIMLNFSAQTNSLSIQQTIESKLEKKKGKSIIGAKGNKTTVIFIDDVNMPQVEKFGAQPPIELLRQLLDRNEFYDRPAFFKKKIDKYIVLCAAAPPGGGRSALTPRFMRHFHILCVPDASEYSMKTIFDNIIEKFLSFNHFSDQVKKCGNIAVSATIELYSLITSGLLPIPAKFHYTFNLRDVAKVFQGILMTKTISIQSSEIFTKLWIHECSRVFHDRLINEEDREFFRDSIIELLKNKFKINNWVKEEIFFGKSAVIFSMLLKLDSEDKLYEEIQDKNKLFKTLEDRLTDYNLSKQNKMDLVFFDDAINHICRISRILKQPRGNAMLIGVSGCGKQSLTRLSSFMLEYACFQIKLSKNYHSQSFKDDLKLNMLISGCDAIPNTFLMTDTQIMNESFLEDLNNILNTGEITNLYLKEDKDRIQQALQKIQQQLKKSETFEYAYPTYIERLRDNFHIILCMSPVGDQLRIRCRKFPSLVNCCTLDWFDNWPEDALLNVSMKFIQKIDNLNNNVRVKFSKMFMKVHKSVEKMSERFYLELRRKVYITPKSYLDGINLYLAQLGEKSKEFKENIARLSNGILKLQTTNSQIADLKIFLQELQPKLESEKINAQNQAVLIKESKVIASQNEIETQNETVMVSIDAKKIEELKKEAEVELAKARPAMEEAQRVADSLSKDDIDYLKKTNVAIPEVHDVVKCILIYLGRTKFEWIDCQKAMAGSTFLAELKGYDKDNISDIILNKVKPYVQKPSFHPDVVTPKNKPAGGMARWCIAIREYAIARKNVIPKEIKLREMSEKLAEKMITVDKKKQELEAIKAKLQYLEDENQKTKDYIEKLDEDKRVCERRLHNAGKLIELLGDEGERWKSTVEELKREEGKLYGNVFIAAASISYIGPFTGVYREKLVENWVNLCQKNQILVSDKYSLVNTLGNPLHIRDWGLKGLPSDTVSIDNGILSSKTQRWPLMIDPQSQANSWIKNMNKEKGFIAMRLSASNESQKSMETAILQGLTVLIEDISEEIDPGLDSVLTKSVYKDQGVEKINFGGKPLMYDKNFKLFITTKLANPHFLPELCIKLTIINFTVTFDGLEEQLLVDVVKNEAPEVEIKRDSLVMSIAKSKNELKALENLILQELANSSQDDILDNDVLIVTLENSKHNSKVISQSLIEAEQVEITINTTRNSYRKVSTRGSILYFTIADLAGIDPMYQNSLAYVKKLFNYAIVHTPQCDNLEDRIISLENSTTKMLYINICRGLFEAHKLIYSFLICSQIKRKSKSINEACWNLFLRGAGIFNKNDQPPRPESIYNFVSEPAWDLAYCLEMNCPLVFGGLCKCIESNAQKWEQYTFFEEDNYIDNIPCGYGQKLQIFEKLLILKIFKPEKLMFACQKYVQMELGKIYAESPVASMEALFSDSNKKNPIIFVLSQGADPTEQIIQFAKKMDFYDKLHYKSLGQGQEYVAKELIEKGKLEGNWVLLQNCHLFKSWMTALEAICEKFNEDEKLIDDNFRLILTSMPAEYFPVAILQNGLKMTTEPPRGIKANLKRTYTDIITEQDYSLFRNSKEGSVIGDGSLIGGIVGESINNSDQLRKLLFGLSFFHSLVQERRKFGPLGWNIRYEFNDSDLDTSIIMLKNFLLDAAEIPWDAMKYMTGQINYGGRVTDDWDRTLLLSMLSKFFTEDILQEGYTFSQSGLYFVPVHERVEQIQQYIDNLPQSEQPEVFGMHQNANIAYQQQESEKIVSTILNVQPRVVVGEGGKSSDDIIFELATELENNLPPILDKEDHAKEIFKLTSKNLLQCLSTVLLQEIERYNKLLKKMGITLTLLMKAIKGQVVMSPELDLMYSALIKNQVPPNWQEVSYPSLKPLASWVKDLSFRVEFMRNWLKTGHPPCYWLSGFFFPHGFMTGTLQTYARKHMEAIDLLEFSFKVMQQTSSVDILKAPEDGIIVYGLFIEGAKWSFVDECLEEQNPGEMSYQMPLIHFLPIKKKQAQNQQNIGSNTNDAKSVIGLQGSQVQNVSYSEDYNYKCPCYKTSVRAGVLSTTGQSTNFILAVDLPCSENEQPEHWTLRGTALLSMLND